MQVEAVKQNSHSHFRCPFCHDAVSETDLQSVRCEQCRAPMHASCWAELGCCGACRHKTNAPAVVAVEPEPTPEPIPPADTLFLRWCVSVDKEPRYQDMFRHLRMDPSTERLHDQFLNILKMIRNKQCTAALQELFQLRETPIMVRVFRGQVRDHEEIQGFYSELIHWAFVKGEQHPNIIESETSESMSGPLLATGITIAFISITLVPLARLVFPAVPTSVIPIGFFLGLIATALSSLLNNQRPYSFKRVIVNQNAEFIDDSVKTMRELRAFTQYGVPRAYVEAERGRVERQLELARQFDDADMAQWFVSVEADEHYQGIFGELLQAGAAGEELHTRLMAILEDIKQLRYYRALNKVRSFFDCTELQQLRLDNPALFQRTLLIAIETCHWSYDLARRSGAVLVGQRRETGLGWQFSAKLFALIIAFQVLIHTVLTLNRPWSTDLALNWATVVLQVIIATIGSWSNYIFETHEVLPALKPYLHPTLREKSLCLPVDFHYGDDVTNRGDTK